ncbi:MAG: hypothetical protein HZB79_08240 [Deltaproteobacteria bacterium]|nr:hypothetical protein [Deltaproteobacteria bacterium]
MTGITIGVLGYEAYTYFSKGERNWEKGRGDDPFWNKSPEELREIERKGTASEKERAKKIRKQKEKKDRQTGKQCK